MKNYGAKDKTNETLIKIEKEVLADNRKKIHRILDLAGGVLGRKVTKEEYIHYSLIKFLPEDQADIHRRKMGVFLFASFLWIEECQNGLTTNSFSEWFKQIIEFNNKSEVL